MRLRRDPNGDRGVTIVVVAGVMGSLLLMVALVVDGGAGRSLRQDHAVSTDAAALAGAAALADGDGASACAAAWDYLKANVGVDPSGGGTMPNCASLASPCSASTSARTATAASGPLTFTITHPVPDGDPLLAGQPLNASVDGEQCQRLGVAVSEVRGNFFADGSMTVGARSVGRLNPDAGGAPGVAPLILLDPTGCEVLTLSNNAEVLARGVGSEPGRIIVDSDATGCSGDHVIELSNNAELTVESAGGSPGALSMHAITAGNGDRAIYAANNADYSPEPSGSAAPTGRAPVDERYGRPVPAGHPDAGTALDTLADALGGTGTPAGFTKWSDHYSCDVSNNNELIVPAGDWYIDCASGFEAKNNATLIIGDGRVVMDAPIKLKNNARVAFNCGAPTEDDIDDCDMTPSSNGLVFVRTGGFLDAKNNADVVLAGTAVIQAGEGAFDLKNNLDMSWTAPSSGDLEDLAFWSESSEPIEVENNGDIQIEGVFFAPNAHLSLDNNAELDGIRAQLWLKTASLSNNTELTLDPVAGRNVDVTVSVVGPDLIR